MNIEIPDELVIPIAAAVDEWKQSRERNPVAYKSAPNACAEIRDRLYELDLATRENRSSKQILDDVCLRLIATSLRAITEVESQGKSHKKL
jgi:hypothetical protein